MATMIVREIIHATFHDNRTLHGSARLRVDLAIPSINIYSSRDSVQLQDSEYNRYSKETRTHPPRTH